MASNSQRVPYTPMALAKNTSTNHNPRLLSSFLIVHPLERFSLPALQLETKENALRSLGIQSQIVPAVF